MELSRLVVAALIAGCGHPAVVATAPEPPEPPPQPLQFEPLGWGLSMTAAVAALERAGMHPEPNEAGFGAAHRALTRDLIADEMPFQDPSPVIAFVPREGWTGVARYDMTRLRLLAVELRTQTLPKRAHDEILRLKARHGRPDVHQMIDVNTVQAIWTRDGIQLVAIAMDGYLSITYQRADGGG